MTFVKICGLTNLADAQTAVDAVADLLGFICYPKSPRYITPAQITAILTDLRPPTSDLRPVPSASSLMNRLTLCSAF